MHIPLSAQVVCEPGLDLVLAEVDDCLDDGWLEGDQNSADEDAVKCTTEKTLGGSILVQKGHGLS